MSVVAIHQPNYLPWLGYFAKLARADHFILLDDAQFPKNSYTNRVQLRGADRKVRWLTLPVSVHLGDPIDRVSPAQTDWATRHLDSLRGCYSKAPAWRAVKDDIEALYAGVPEGSLAAINQHLIAGLAGHLGLTALIHRASEIGFTDLRADGRLVALVAAVAPGGTYLSGRGGAKYQEPAKFAAAGLELAYADFLHPTYDQDRMDFVPGLSLIDAVCRLGWAATAALIRGD